MNLRQLALLLQGRALHLALAVVVASVAGTQWLGARWTRRWRGQGLSLLGLCVIHAYYVEAVLVHTAWI